MIYVYMFCSTHQKRTAEGAELCLVGAPRAHAFEELAVAQVLAPPQGALQRVGVAERDCFALADFDACFNGKTAPGVVCVARVGGAVVRHEVGGREESANAAALRTHLERVHLQHAAHRVHLLFGEASTQPPQVAYRVHHQLLVCLPNARP
jgi:hypothetical protein